MTASHNDSMNKTIMIAPFNLSLTKRPYAYTQTENSRYT